ncbi:unnamed protein product, partial [Effrenium voratum]
MDAHAPQLAEVCMRQAVRLEQLHAELDKARRSESAALEELEKRREAHEQERAEMRDKVARMAVFQEALQRENGLLLEELVSVLGRAKALKAEMAWIQRFLPMTEPARPPPSVLACGCTRRPGPPQFRWFRRCPRCRYPKCLLHGIAKPTLRAPSAVPARPEGPIGPSALEAVMTKALAAILVAQGPRLFRG